MRKLTKISKTCWTTLAVFSIMLSGTIVLLFNLKMDVSFSTKLLTTQSINRFYANSRQASLLKKVTKIRLFFNDSFHNATISDINKSKTKDMYEVIIVETFADILPGSTISAKIIYKTKKLYEEIFGKIL